MKANTLRSVSSLTSRSPLRSRLRIWDRRICPTSSTSSTRLSRGVSTTWSTSRSDAYISSSILKRTLSQSSSTSSSHGLDTPAKWSAWTTLSSWTSTQALSSCRWRLYSTNWGNSRNVGTLNKRSVAYWLLNLMILSIPPRVTLTHVDWLYSPPTTLLPTKFKRSFGMRLPSQWLSSGKREMKLVGSPSKRLVSGST